MASSTMSRPNDASMREMWNDSINRMSIFFSLRDFFSPSDELALSTDRLRLWRRGRLLTIFFRPSRNHDREHFRLLIVRFGQESKV